MNQNITILPEEKPKLLKLGWNVYDSEESLQASIKAEQGEAGLDEYFHRNHPDRQTEIDKADIYRGDGKRFERPSNVGFRCMKVLPQLYGKPWNNEAVNMIVALRPSSVRVTTGMIHLDNMIWRVTVYLEKDNITIRQITQEVEVGIYGHGAIKNVSNNPPSKGFAIINEHALKKIVVE